MEVREMGANGVMGWRQVSAVQISYGT